MATNDDIYKGNNASDYQPTTRNPQSTSTDLQQGTSQPTSTQSDITQQRLPKVDDLRVVILQNGAGSTNEQLTPVQTATQTWVGPFWGCVILITLTIIIWAVRVLSKEEAPKLAEAIEEAIKEPIIQKEPDVIPMQATVKKKKPAKKLPTKKTSKKSKKKK